MAHRLASSEKTNTAAAEKAEARLVPILRSVENAMLATDAADLLAQVPAPVRFVTLSEDTLTPNAYLTRVCEERDGFELVVVQGERGLSYARPAEAVRAIDPGGRRGHRAGRAS